MFDIRPWLAAAALAGALAACDNQRIAKLEEGVATEADVRREFGEPAVVYTEDGGARTFEYPRQPEGRRNYMITIGTDGKMSALRQVLTPDHFAKVTPGLDKAQVRRLLGKPAKTQFYEIRKEEVWDWRFVDGGQNKSFSVTFDGNGVVTGQGIGPDPADTQTGG
jgi:hypothetical protein